MFLNYGNFGNQMETKSCKKVAFIIVVIFVTMITCEKVVSKNIKLQLRILKCIWNPNGNQKLQKVAKSCKNTNLQKEDNQ